MVWATLLSVLVVWLVQPSIWFFLGSLFVLNIGTTLRHWCEHLGTAKDRESNTYWFPLGMGIGNHETHHHHAHLSWLTLSIGLMYRKRQTNPLKALLGVMFDKNFGHYRARVTTLEYSIHKGISNIECRILNFEMSQNNESHSRSAHNGLEETQRLNLKIRLSEIGKFRTCFGNHPTELR